jgi:uncharacterized protein (DUF3820 family)
MNSEDQEACEYVHPDNNVLLKLAKAKMPFGKYEGYLHCRSSRTICRLVFPEGFSSRRIGGHELN